MSFYENSSIHPSDELFLQTTPDSDYRITSRGKEGHLASLRSVGALERGSYHELPSSFAPSFGWSTKIELCWNRIGHGTNFTPPSSMRQSGHDFQGSKSDVRKARSDFPSSQELKKMISSGWAWTLVFIAFLKNFEIQTGWIWALHVAPSQGVSSEGFEIRICLLQGTLRWRHLKRCFDFEKNKRKWKFCGWDTSAGGFGIF